MQKNLSLILADTKRSKYYLHEIIKNKIFLKKILFYSNKKGSLFNKIKKYKNVEKIYYVKTNDINSKKIGDLIKKFLSEYILFSGNNAEIIRNNELLKKKLIHCHPGLLPKYRGSVVTYYSLILENKIFVSIFRISNKIDKGKVLFTKKIKYNKKLQNIEGKFDHCIRAKALVDFIKKKKETIQKREGKNFNFYYIPHPIIRNIITKPKEYIKSII